MSNFLQYLITGIADGCLLALLGSGFVAIQRVTGVINFAQGTFSVVGGLVAYSALAQAGLPHGVSELLGVVAAGVVGLVVGLIAIGKKGTPPIASLIITLALAVAAYAIEIQLWGDAPLSYNGIGGVFTIDGAQLQRQYVLIIAVTVVVFALLALFFNRTYTGEGLTACASNPYAASVVGISVRKMGFLAFAIGGLLGGIAGVLVMPIQPLAYSSDINLAIGGFAAAIFGGLSGFGLAFAGGVILGVAEQMVAGYYQSSYTTVVALVLMLALMVYQSFRRKGSMSQALSGNP